MSPQTSLFTLSPVCGKPHSVTDVGVCVHVGAATGWERAHLQDFELMQSRQGVRVDECQVVTCKSSE